jgi:hypothetical protein
MYDMTRIHYCLLLLAYLSSFSTMTSQQTQQTYTGELLVTHTEDPATSYYMLKAEDGELYTLHFPDSQEIDAKTGDIISVTVDNLETPPMPMPMPAISTREAVAPAPILPLAQVDLSVSKLSVVQASDQMASVITPMTSITFVVSLCDVVSTITPSMVNDVWFNNTDGDPSLQQYYHDCSFGKMSFNPENNYIFPEVISVPCSGMYRNKPYNWNNSCSDQELYGAKTIAQNYIASRNVDLSKFPRKIMILSSLGNACPWVGLANMGCGTDCNVWLYEKYFSVDLVFHEVGHTLWLGHSGVPKDGYGDRSCAMGSIYGPRCLNAPQSSNMKWNSPIANISNLQANQSITLTIPGFVTDEHNYVQYKRYYFSYRILEGMDSMMMPTWANRLSIHTMNRSFDHTLVMDVTLKVKSITTLPDYPLQIRIDKIRSRNITVSFCYFCIEFPPSPPPPPALPPPSGNVTSLFVWVPKVKSTVQYIDDVLCPALEYAVSLAVRLKSQFVCRYVADTWLGLYYQALFNIDDFSLFQRYIEKRRYNFTINAKLPCRSTVTGGPNIPGAMYLFTVKAARKACV